MSDVCGLQVNIVEQLAAEKPFPSGVGQYQTAGLHLSNRQKRDFKWIPEK